MEKNVNMRLNKKEMMIPRPQCFCCKSSLEICRNDDNQDVIYFDRHLYHKKCFEEMNKVKKKCFYCGQDIDITCTEDETVYYDKHFYHKHCFKEWCNATKRPSKKREMALLNIDNYVNEARIHIQGLLDKKKISSESIKILYKDAKLYIENWFDASDLCAFIRDEYDIQVVPWRKISEILNGNDPKLDGAVPAKSLLDMWQRKSEFLRKQNEKLIAKSDKELSKENIINYDLAILVNKYDSYLKWLEKQRIVEAEKDIAKSQNIVSQSIGYNNKSKNVDVNDSDDISNLVDDIFG